MSSEIDSGGTETMLPSDYASDETTSLLVYAPIKNDVETSRPVSIQSSRSQQQHQQQRDKSLKNGSKPMLIRQDCMSSRLSVSSPRPLLSSMGGMVNVGSEESGTSVPMEENGVRSVPDIELHCRLNDGGSPHLLGDGSGGLFYGNGTQSPRLRARGSSVTSYGHLNPNSQYKYDRRRESHSRLLSMPRSVSRESIRSIGNQHIYQCTPYSIAPAVLLTTTSSNCRVIRQSSQPESSLGRFLSHSRIFRNKNKQDFFFFFN